MSDLNLADEGVSRRSKLKQQSVLNKASTTAMGDFTHPKATYLRRLSKLGIAESSDFEEPDGENIRIQYKKRTRKNLVISDICDYGLAAVVAIAVAIIYLLVSFSVEIFADWRKELLVHYVLEEHNLATAWLVGAGSCLLFALIGAALVWIEPSAAGSGMPEVIMYLNGLQLQKYGTWRALFCKVLALVCLVSSGLFSGFDGPMAHIGLIVAILSLETISKSKTLARLFFGDKQETIVHADDDTNNILNAIHRHRSRRFTASGAAAGLAAAFHAPLGGVMFALEEAISFFSPSIIIRTLFTTALSYFVIGYFGNFYQIQSYIFSTSYALVPNTTDCLNQIAVSDILWFILAGTLAGLVGSIYNRVVIFVLSLRLRFLSKRPFVRMAEIVIVCLLTTTVVVFLPHAFGNECTPFEQAVHHMAVQEANCFVDCSPDLTKTLTENPVCYASVCLPETPMMNFQKQFFGAIERAEEKCPSNGEFRQAVVSVEELAREFEFPETFIVNQKDKCYYQLPSLLFVYPGKVLDNLFSRGTYHIFDAKILAVYAAVYLVLSISTYNIMLPSDLVIPNLIFGAICGRLFGLGVNSIKASLGQLLIDPGSYALIGAAAFWSGTSRLVLTIAIVAVESTLDLSYLLGILIAVFMATTVGNWFSHSLYHMEIHIRKLPLLPYNAPYPLHGLRVLDIMSRKLVVLHESQTAKEIFGKLAACAHQGFPVVADFVIEHKGSSSTRPDLAVRKWKLLGMIAREQLKDKLKVTVRVSEEDEHIIRGTLTRDKAESALQALREAQEQNMAVQVEMTDYHTGTNIAYDSALDHDETMIDLTKIMTYPPHTVHMYMSAHKAFGMFRNLGLRHLCVIDDDFCIVGILSRKDFLKGAHGADPPLYDMDQEPSPAILAPNSPKVHAQ